MSACELSSRRTRTLTATDRAESVAAFGGDFFARVPRHSGVRVRPCVWVSVYVKGVEGGGRRRTRLGRLFLNGFEGAEKTGANTN